MIHKKLLSLAIAILVSAPIGYSAPASGDSASRLMRTDNKKYVLAHAMGCCSPSVALHPYTGHANGDDGVSYWRYAVGGLSDEMVKYVNDPLGGAREEIRLAKRAGIDAFGVFNNGDILGPSRQFSKQTEGYWQAAAKDGTFKVYPEIWVLDSDKLIDATVRELAYLKEKYDDAWLRIDGKRVIFFAQQKALLKEGVDVEKTVAKILEPLGGRDAVYVGLKASPRDQDYDSRYGFRPPQASEAWLHSTDAVVHWNAESYGEDVKADPAMNAYAKAVNKELWMKAVPAYFVLRGNFGPWAVERLGMSGYYENWLQIIEQKPRVAYIITWNDNSEDSGVMPDINHRQSVLELTKYFTSWYKNGTAPKVEKEQLLVFHHPQLTETPMKLLEGAKPCLRHNSQATPPTDYIQVVAMLKSEAVVNVDLECGKVYQRIASKRLPAGVNFWLIYHPLASAKDSALKNSDDVNVPEPLCAPMYPPERADFFITKLPEALKPREIFVGVERNGERIGYFRSHEPVVGAASKANLSTIGNVFVLDDQP